MAGSQNRSSSIRGRATALPSHTRGGSRMRESRTYGSVRGACDETHVPTATIAICCTAYVGEWEASFRCGARVQTLSEVKRTCRDHRHRIDPTRLTLMYGPAVRC